MRHGCLEETGSAWGYRKCLGIQEVHGETGSAWGRLDVHGETGSAWGTGRAWRTQEVLGGDRKYTVPGDGKWLEEVCQVD